MQGRAPGRVEWISDFADPQSFERPLHRLRRAGYRVGGWLPQIASDRAVAPGGFVRIVDPETGADLRVALDAAMCQAMRVQLQLLRRQQDQLFVRCGFALRRLQLPDDAFDAGQWLEALWTSRR